MKNYKMLLSAVVGAVLLMSNYAAQAGEKAGVVTLIRLVGRAVYSLDGGHTWIPAVVGKEFQPGTLIRTEDRSLADVLVGESAADRTMNGLQIKTADRYYNSQNLLLKSAAPIIERNIVRLQPNTILGVDKLLIPDADPSVVSDCELDLKKGRILATVRKVSPSSEYLVKVPNGVAAVRGTQFALSVEGVDVSVQVVNGTVWLALTMVNTSTGAPLTDANGDPLSPVSISIPAGQGFNLTPTLVNQMINVINTPGLTLQAVTSQLSALTTSAVTPTPAGPNQVLVTFFNGLTTSTYTVTAAPGNTTTPVDVGIAPYTSPH